MGIYSDLAPWYDRLFPVGADQAEFIVESLRSAEARSVLDAGCGTGRHLEILADAGFAVAGLEPEAEMAVEANRRLAERGRVEVLGLHDAARVPGTPFDAALCLGNTLAHMLDDGDLSAGLAALASVLMPGGLFIAQLVHFEKVLREGRDPFAEKRLEDGSRFHRAYDFSRAPARLGFRLRFESGDVRYEESFDLRPWSLEELGTHYSSAGFEIIEVVGDWKGTPRGENSPATIILARRGDRDLPE